MCSLVGSFSLLCWLSTTRRYLPQAVGGPETHPLKMNFLTTFLVAKKVKTSPKDVRLNKFKKKKSRNSPPELDKEGLTLKGQSQHKLYFTLFIFLACNYTWKEKKKTLHLFKGTEKIPIGSMFLSLLLFFLRLTLIQGRVVDIIRAHMFRKRMIDYTLD